jgi:hypothetical protein
MPPARAEGAGPPQSAAPVDIARRARRRSAGLLGCGPVPTGRVRQDLPAGCAGRVGPNERLEPGRRHAPARQHRAGSICRKVRRHQVCAGSRYSVSERRRGAIGSDGVRQPELSPAHVQRACFGAEEFHDHRYAQFAASRWSATGPSGRRRLWSGVRAPVRSGLGQPAGGRGAPQCQVRSTTQTFRADIMAATCRIAACRAHRLSGMSLVR